VTAIAGIGNGAAFRRRREFADWGGSLKELHWWRTRTARHQQRQIRKRTTAVSPRIGFCV